MFVVPDSHGWSINRRTGLPYHDPSLSPVPPFHPDTPVIRREWAQYYHSIYVMDRWFGRWMQRIRDEGLLENTIIFVYSDHGGGMPSYKQMAYNRGFHVPLLVYIPEKYTQLAPGDYAPGGATRRLVEFVDLAPTLLSLIGVEPPQWMQGEAFMGHYEAAPGNYLFGSRGRMDERIDMVRTVRDDRYMYIRNYMPHLEKGNLSQYSLAFASTKEWQDLYRSGELKPPQTYVWEPKPPEELYDLKADPYEIRNLAHCPNHQEKLFELRTAHRSHMIRTRDAQFLTESEMHRRAKGTTSPIWNVQNNPNATSIYEMIQDPDRFEFEKIFAMAELAADYSWHAIPMLEAGLKDADPAIRYWAALGLLVRGKQAFEAAERSIRESIYDQNPGVRIIISEILATYGNETDRNNALKALAQLARPDEYGVYVAIEALNSINNLGELPEQIKIAILENPREDPKAISRGANEYIIRLMPGYPDDFR